MTIKTWVKLIAWILIFEIIGYFLGGITQANIDPWYRDLHKSSLTPPDVVFAVTWSFLYILLAIVGWHLSKYKNHPNVWAVYRLYWIQMCMNWAWPILFFQLHWVGFSFIWMCGLIAFNIAIFAWMKPKELVWLLLPYLIWLIFATYLNGVVWYLN